MTGRLIKYEMKAFGRIMLPLYIIFIAVSVICGIGLKLTGSALADRAVIIFMAAGNLMILLVAAIFIVLVVLLAVRFYRSVSGEGEGYLTFSLPVRTSTLIWSKALSALIWTALTFAVAVLSAVILFLFSVWRYSGAVNQSPSSVIFDIAVSGGTMSASDAIGSLLLSITVFLAFTTRIYAAISIGQTWNRHRVLGSFLAYLVLMIITDAVTVLFMNTDIPGFADPLAPQAAWPQSIAAICAAAVFSLITWYFLDRKLNLE